MNLQTRPILIAMYMLTVVACGHGSDPFGAGGFHSGKTLPPLTDVNSLLSIPLGLRLSEVTGQLEAVAGPLFLGRTHAFTGDMKWFRRPTDADTFAGVKVGGTFYGFADGALVEVAVFPVFGSEGKALIQKVERRYKGKALNHETWLWKDSDVGIEYTGFCGLDSAAVAGLFVFRPDHVVAVP